MNAATASEAVVLGAMTGVRSMAGVATLGFRHGGLPAGLTAAMALGEMAADKLPFMPGRTERLPLLGRLTMGAIVGARIAQRRGASRLLGATLGASAAVIGAHLAYRIRVRLPVPNVVGGLIEDAVVLAAGAVCLRSADDRLRAASARRARANQHRGNAGPEEEPGFGQGA